MQVLWRLRSPSSEQVSECHILEHTPLSFELRFVHVRQGLSITTSCRFIANDAATRCAALLATALCADGCSDASDKQPS